MASIVKVAVTIGLAIFVIVGVMSAEPPAQDRAQAIGSVIRCPVCEGESIADSPSGLARDMMNLVRARIDEGYSDSQIIDELLSSYSGSQLLDPPLSVSTIALWLLPALALVGGAWILVRSRRPGRRSTEAAEQ